MNGRYKAGISLHFDFDLIAGKELVAAFRVVDALDQMNIPGELGNKLHAMRCALREEIVAIQTAYIESSKYDLCVVCKTEINKHLNNHIPADDLYPGLGLFKHRVCPFLKSNDERDEPFVP